MAAAGAFAPKAEEVKEIFLNTAQIDGAVLETAYQYAFGSALVLRLCIPEIVQTKCLFIELGEDGRTFTGVIRPERLSLSVINSKDLISAAIAAIEKNPTKGIGVDALNQFAKADPMACCEPDNVVRTLRAAIDSIPESAPTAG